MANQEHVNLLLKSVEEFNAWRKEHPDEVPDLAGADLTRADLAGADLNRANLIKTNLAGADLNRANLTDVVADAVCIKGLFSPERISQSLCDGLIEHIQSLVVE